MKKRKNQINIQVKCHLPYEDYESHPFCHKIHLPNQSVSDALVDEIDDWDCLYPILIDAPTGLGKTTFVYEELLPRAMHKGKNILLISNRIALSVQQKIKIMQLLNSPLQGMLTDQGIQAQEKFESVAVITYHRLINFLNDPENGKWCENIEYVVADEAHFFTSDSLFNRDCDLILNKLTSRFCKAIRIYLTATPWDVVHRLAESEQENYRNLGYYFASLQNRIFKEPRFMYHYYFERNYDKYQLNFFQEFSELIPLINTNSSDKWLIFIDDKAAANELKSALTVSVTYFDSSKKGGSQWNELLESEKFDSKVLISTSVLDCGINIHDPKLKNIIIISDNRTAVMQMAGRKRCEKNETVTLWIQDLPKQKISYRYKRYLEAQRLEKEFDNIKTDKEMQAFVNQIWNSEDTFARNLFSVMLHSVSKNRCAFVYISRTKRFFERILKGETTFRKEVENWFGKEHPEIVSEIDIFYEQHMGADLKEEDKDLLRSIVVQAYKKSGKIEAQPSRDNKLKHNALNNRLKEMALPYEIRSCSGIWRLHYIETNNLGGAYEKRA